VGHSAKTYAPYASRQAMRLATGVGRFLAGESPPVVNWVKSGTWLIIHTQVGAVNQTEWGVFCAGCTKNGGDFDTKGLSLSCPKGDRGATKKPHPKAKFLEKTQRKKAVLAKKRGFSPKFFHYLPDLGIISAFFARCGIFVQPAEMCSRKPGQRTLIGGFFGKKRRLSSFFSA